MAFPSFLVFYLNHAMTQVVNCQYFIVEAWVQSQASTHEIWWGKVFSECCGFTVTIIELTVPHSHIIHLPTKCIILAIYNTFTEHTCLSRSLSLLLILQIYYKVLKIICTIRYNKNEMQNILLVIYNEYIHTIFGKLIETVQFSMKCA